MQTRKTLFLLSAIALTIRLLWGLIRLTPWMHEWYLEHIWGHPVRVEIYWLPYTWLLLGGILLATAAFLVRVDTPQPVPKWHKFSTYALAVLSLVTLIAALVHSAVMHYGIIEAWAPDWLNMLLLVAGCAWVWSLVANPCAHNVSKGLRIAIWCSIGLILLLLLLQLISGMSYITIGHIQFFHTYSFGLLLRYLIPAVLLCIYSVELMKRNDQQLQIILLAPALAGFSSCGMKHANTSHNTLAQNDSTWAQELSQRNPFANDTNYISVYFRFDTIVNGYDVRGIYFPSYKEENKHDRWHGWFYECGVIMYFRNTATGKEYKFTDFDERCKSFKNIFMSKNVYDINTSDDFNGYKSGDAYIFHYDNTDDAIDAEFLFRDIDIDGEDELLIGYYRGGPYECNAYDIYKITSSALIDTKIMIDEYELLAIMKNHLYVSGLSSSKQNPFPQITSFTDYVYENLYISTISDTVGFLRQLDIEFPTGMKNKKVLAKIQEQLIDTLLHTRYHISQLDEAMAKYWRIEPDEIERNSTYSLTVPNDSDEYFDYGGVPSRQFEHLCGRTSYNRNGLYIMRHHYTWYDGGFHHFPNTQYFAFDTRTGKILHFMDIFSEDYEDPEKQMIYDISYYARRALLDKYPKISLQYWIQASFTLTPTSLVLHYTHYTLGCWADGEQEIEIPLETAKLFLNPNWKHLIP